MLREFIVRFTEERLTLRGAPSQSEESERPPGECDLCPDEAVLPVPVNWEHVPQQCHGALIIRASEIDQLAARTQCGVEPPGARESVPGRGLRRSGSPTLPGCRDVNGGPTLKGAERAVVEAVPHLSLPPAVEVFQGSLEARILDRGEDRSAARLQAEPADLPHHVGELVRSLEARVVVELCERRDPEGPPPALQGKQHADRRYTRGGPGVWQARVERDAGEHLHFGAALEHEALDNVETVTVGRPARDQGQVPAPRRGGPADALLAIEGATPLQDPPDGPHGGWGSPVRHGPLAIDGARTVLPERARLPELPAEREDVVLDSGWRPVHQVGNRWLICPVDAVQAAPLCTSDPALHRGDTHLERPGHSTEGLACAHGCYHCPTSRLTTLFCAMLPTSHARSLFQYTVTEGVAHNCH